MRGRRLALALAAIALVTAAGSSAARPSFQGSVTPISAALAKEMTGVSWRPGCPVALRDLRLITATHHGFDGRDRIGRLIVHRDVAARVLVTLRRLYLDGFPIRRMVPVDVYGGSDFRSIEADNTSAFNCRFVDGTTRYSEHGYGRAIDVNPIENPYVSGGGSSHAASAPFLDRSRHRPGTAYEGGILVDAFRAAGWGWGGSWSGSVHDYQHFSYNGR
jgi:D-alanyl-D-alanine carboxypeptidase-like protein